MAIIVDVTQSAAASPCSLLGMTQSFCRRTNISVPVQVIGNTEPQIAQIYALLEEEGNDLSGRGDWEVLTREAIHTTIATESQGAIGTIATDNFRYVRHNTLWDRTENLPITSIDGPDWQAEKGFAATSPRYRARIRGGDLIVTPTPPAGSTWAFEYVSWNWILDVDGGTRKQYFEADTDTVLLPCAIVMMGLRWRWKKEKGLEYAEDFRTYEMMANDALGRERLRTTLHMDGADRSAAPHILVNQGSWNL